LVRIDFDKLVSEFEIFKIFDFFKWFIGLPVILTGKPVTDFGRFQALSIDRFIGHTDR
jgi:hypothetical protein